MLTSREAHRPNVQMLRLGSFHTKFWVSGFSENLRSHGDVGAPDSPGM